MLKRICDFCGVEITGYDRDSQTQYYSLIRYSGTTFETKETECDICNKCLKKIIAGGAE